jgi:proline iminopeptidase
LITVGKYDELTPACARRMQLALPGAELVVFPNSSHTPFFEEPEAYGQVLLNFLNTHRS